MVLRQFTTFRVDFANSIRFDEVVCRQVSVRLLSNGDVRPNGEEVALVTITELRVGGIDLLRQNDSSLMVLWGAIDSTLRGQASGALAGALARDLPIVVDTSRVRFMDTSGGAFLMQLCALARDEGVQVEFPDPSPMVEELLMVVADAVEAVPVAAAT